jgi:hypothetical protein
LNRDGTTGLGFEESLAGNPCTTGEAKSATAARIVVDPEIMMKESLYEPGVGCFFKRQFKLNFLARSLIVASADVANVRFSQVVYAQLSQFLIA